MPASTAWDEVCYNARYPDIRSGYIYAGTDGVWFYTSGQVKGHVVQTKRLKDNAFWHWENFGLAEGRVCGCDLPGTNYSNEFDGNAYLSRYPDVRLSPDWHNNPQGHYQKFGIGEGRHPGYEILYSTSPVGMTSPGTTTLIVDNPDNQNEPGDGTVLPPLGGGDAAPPVISDSSTNVLTEAETWIAGNPIEAAGIGVGILLILYEVFKKKKGRKKK